MGDREWIRRVNNILSPFFDKKEGQERVSFKCNDRVLKCLQSITIFLRLVNNCSLDVHTSVIHSQERVDRLTKLLFVQREVKERVSSLSHSFPILQKEERRTLLPFLFLKLFLIKTTATETDPKIKVFCTKGERYDDYDDEMRNDIHTHTNSPIVKVWKGGQTVWSQLSSCSHTLTLLSFFSSWLSPSSRRTKINEEEKNEWEVGILWNRTTTITEIVSFCSTGTREEDSEDSFVETDEHLSLLKTFLKVVLSCPHCHCCRVTLEEWKEETENDTSTRTKHTLHRKRHYDRESEVFKGPRGWNNDVLSQNCSNWKGKQLEKRGKVLLTLGKHGETENKKREGK